MSKIMFNDVRRGDRVIVRHMTSSGESTKVGEVLYICHTLEALVIDDESLGCEVTLELGPDYKIDILPKKLISVKWVNAGRIKFRTMIFVIAVTCLSAFFLGASTYMAYSLIEDPHESKETQWKPTNNPVGLE